MTIHRREKEPIYWLKQLILENNRAALLMNNVIIN